MLRIQIVESPGGISPPGAPRTVREPPIRIRRFRVARHREESLGSAMTRPCLSELAARPRRLFGFDGTAGGVPGSQTVLDDLGVDGHPPATAARLLGESGK
jgi:hypothetical protein